MTTSGTASGQYNSTKNVQPSGSVKQPEIGTLTPRQINKMDPPKNINFHRMNYEKGASTVLSATGKRLGTDENVSSGVEKNENNENNSFQLVTKKNKIHK